MLRADLRFLRSEIWLIFGRRRNWLGLAILAVVPLIIAIATKASDGDDPTTFFSQITDNGLFVALAALSMEIALFLPLAVSAIAADSIAGEANVGTLRYLLSVPVLRTRLVVVKYLAIVVFTFAATTLVAVVGMLAGLALFGGGDVVLLSGDTVGFGEGLLRVLAVAGYLALVLCAVGAIGLFVSSLTEQPVGAGIATLILVIMSFILGAIPQLEWLHGYLLTQYWMSFGDLLRLDIPWSGDLRSGVLSAGAYILIFTTAAWARFSGKDVTS
jgi:ABC-2 type transport system permease protein